jgi:TolA-binding protein
MELCSNGHDEICFTSRSCPLCDAQTESKDEIGKLQNKIETLENQVEDFTFEIQELQSQIAEGK